MKLPNFSLPASNGKTYTQEDFKNKKIILYLYPKDMTSGCTLESKIFQSLKTEFEKLDFSIFGLSKDSIKSHEKFCTKEALTFPLLSDEECKLIEALGSWVEKSMYGRTYMGIDRSTFIIVDGTIEKEWRKVKAKGHAEVVLEFCKNY